MDKVYNYQLVRGSVSPEPLECINPYKNKWRLRWDIKQVEVESGTDPETQEPTYRTEWQYMEAEFLYKPMINEIRAIVTQWYENEVNPEEYYINDSKVWYSNSDRATMKSQTSLLSGDMEVTPTVTLDAGLASVAMDGMNNYAYTAMTFKNDVLDQISKANSIYEINQIDLYSGLPESVHSDTATLTIQSSMESYSNAEAQAVEFAKLMINNPAMSSSISSQDAVSMQSLYPVYDATTAEGTEVAENYRVRVVTTEEEESAVESTPEIAAMSVQPMMARARVMTLDAAPSVTSDTTASMLAKVKSDILYECIKAHQITADEVPGADTTLWKVAGIDNTGEFGDIIPFSIPMQLFSGKYYSENGITYRCFRDSGIPVYHSLSNLIDLYVGKVDSTDDPMSHAGTYEDPIPYVVGMIITNGTYYSENGVIYMCNRDSEIALTHHLSSLVGLYVIIATPPEPEHAGTKEDPIPFNQGMIIHNGKYYTQNGVEYYCNRDSEIAIYHDLSQLVGQYVEVVEDEPDPEPTQPTGSKEDPIPFTPPMTMSDHLYYSEDGITYECVNSGTIETKLSENTTHVIVADAHKGTVEDPIPYIVGMDLAQDKYYSEDGVTYKCIASVSDLNERLVNASTYVEVYNPEPEPEPEPSEPTGTIDDPIPFTPGMVIYNGKYYTEDGILYNCWRDSVNPINSKLSALVDQYVSVVEDTDEHAGTLEDPIPYSTGMIIYNGKYYSQNDVIYLCNRDSGIALTHNLSDLVGLYVEIVQQ